ncbi:MAG: hypothetical protein LBL45_02800, partial [Treponema sp.]|nr:hypothetical protein [Treponema sp.]
SHDVPLALRRQQAAQAAVYLGHSALLLRRGTLHSHGLLHPHFASPKNTAHFSTQRAAIEALKSARGINAVER